MLGADKQHQIFSSLKRVRAAFETIELKDVTDICWKEIGGYGREFYQHKNILFILSEHARGNTFFIWIYANEEVGDYLNDEHLKVYGITGGQPGWTETYGWLHDGTWVAYIENYIESLRLFVEAEEEKQKGEDVEIAEEERKRLREKVERFNGFFPDDGRTKRCS